MGKCYYSMYLLYSGTFMDIKSGHLMCLIEKSNGSSLSFYNTIVLITREEPVL